MLLCFFLYYVRVIKPHAALEVEDEPYLRSSCASLLCSSDLQKKVLSFIIPTLTTGKKRARHKKKKKRVRHTHSAKMFGRQSDETGNLAHELYFWKMRSHTPLSSFSFY